MSRNLFVFSKPFFRKGGPGTGNISQESKRAMKPLKKELETFRSHGVALYLDGYPSTPGTIAKTCMLAEGFGYMREYTNDDQGNLEKISFNYIRES